MNSRKSIYLWGHVLGTLLIVGCFSGYENTVVATVKYDDGSPVPHGTVSFSNQGFETFGKIENGKVNIGNLDGGVPDGTYQIAVRAYVEKSPQDNMLVPIIARKFEDATTSGIMVEVQGDQEIEIIVSRP